LFSLRDCIGIDIETRSQLFVGVPSRYLEFNTKEV